MSNMDLPGEASRQERARVNRDVCHWLKRRRVGGGRLIGGGSRDVREGRSLRDNGGRGMITRARSP